MASADTLVRVNADQYTTALLDAERVPFNGFSASTHDKAQWTGYQLNNDAYDWLMSYFREHLPAGQTKNSPKLIGEALKQMRLRNLQDMVLEQKISDFAKGTNRTIGGTSLTRLSCGLMNRLEASDPRLARKMRECTTEEALRRLLDKPAVRAIS